MNEITRREYVQTAGLAVLTAGALTVTGANAEDSPTSPKARAFDDVHGPLPLRFDAKSLKGISEKLIQSHWENNYGAPSLH